MHARYAVTFERGLRRQQLAAKSAELGLHVKFDSGRMLLVADEKTPVLAGSEGAAVGQLFDADGRKLNELPQFESLNVLLERTWGNFVLLHEGEGGGNVYRDPSGSISLYRIAGRDGDVLVSDAELALSLGLLAEREVDLDFVVHWLQFPYLRSARTGIRQVREILPGMMGNGSASDWSEALRWRPWDHSRRKSLPSGLRDLGNGLRLVAERAIAAQTKGATLLLQLSGGLDSSIIAACLAASGASFTAVNFVSRSADGDERRHARAVAERFGISLFEIHEHALRGTIEAPLERKFRPGSNPILVPLDEAVENHRLEIGAELLVDGGGGDNLFCYLEGAAPVLDALFAYGPREALHAAADVAEQAGANVWQVLAATPRHMLPKGWRHWNEDRRFLKTDSLLACADPHPWLNAPPLALPGKRDHVASLVHIQHFLDRRVGAGGAVIHPLMAQPLLESCLAIPTREWVRGGLDRAVARDAFRNLLPASVIERRSKGSLQGLFHRSFERIHSELKDLLLSGRLRGLGIADPNAVERAFDADQRSEPETQMRLSEMAALELWLQSWSAD